MPTLTYPALSMSPSSFMMQLKANTVTFRSPLNGAVQTGELPGAMWLGEIRYDSLSEADRRTLHAWLSQLRGMAGRFYLWDMAHPKPRGVATGTPLVNGGSQTGATLVTDGWTASVTNILLPGDYFSVNGELKRVVSATNSNGTGQATITFEPPLRASPSDNAALTLVQPTFTAMLADDDQDQYLVTPGLRSQGHVIKFREAFT